MSGQPHPTGTPCPQCGSVLPADARFCAACGHLQSTRRTRRAPVIAPETPPGPDQIRTAGRGVRCSAYLLDVAAMLSPALPLSITAAMLGVAEIVYIVVPIAFTAVWAWMQIWQGLTGTTFGKAMLGLRLVRSADHRPPGVAAAVVRSGLFLATCGLAGLPVLLSPQPRTGLHDRVTALTVLDVTAGANPLGPRQEQTLLRRSVNRRLNQVHSPVPVATPRRG